LTEEETLALIAQGEGQRVEFKRSLAELETGARAAAAMANTDGGHVLFGVRKDGTILGVEIGAATRELVVQAITDNTDPTLYLSVEYVDVDSRAIIVVTVVRSEDRPHIEFVEDQHQPDFPLPAQFTHAAGEQGPDGHSTGVAQNPTVQGLEVVNGGPGHN